MNERRRILAFYNLEVWIETPSVLYKQSKSIMQ